MTPEDNNLFDDNIDEQPFLEDKEYFSELVGEGKKFADAESLARAKAEADWHIKRIERENAEIRRELTTRQRVEEMLDRMQNSQRNNQSNDLQQDDLENGDDTRTALTAEDVERLLEQRERANSRKQNLTEVENVLKDKLGPNYSQKVRTLTQDLGLDANKAKELAADNPKAFIRLLGLDNTQTERFEPPVRNQVNTAFRPTSTNKKNFAYYEGIRKQQPDKFLPAKYQLEMEREALAQGDNFYL